MSGNHELRERAELLRELHDIVQAMKNVAFAQLQRVNRELPALEEARDTVLRAISSLPTPEGEAAPAVHRNDRDAACACLVIGAERGFCGAFNARLAAVLGQLRRTLPRPVVFVASSRLRELMGPDAAGAQPLLGCSAVEDSGDALEAWLDAVTPFCVPGGELWLLHDTARGEQGSRLWPTPAAAGSVTTRAGGLLHHLPWSTLRDALQRQALQLQLNAALYESLAQENHWRLTQMQLAQDHLDELGQALRRKRSAQRQSDITNEIETLVSALPLGGMRTAKALA